MDMNLSQQTHRTVYIMIFALGMAVSAILSVITLWAVPKVGIAPAAGFLVLLGILVGAIGGIRAALWSMKLGKDTEVACRSVTVADFLEVINTLEKYDKDSALEHFRKRYDEESEQLDKLMEKSMADDTESDS